MSSNLRAAHKSHKSGCFDEGNRMAEALQRYMPVVAGLAVGVAIAVVPDLAGARDTTIFTDMKDVTDTFNTNVIAVVRSAGIAALLVCGGIFLLTGKANTRLLWGCGAGLLIAAFATPIVNYLMPA